MKIIDIITIGIKDDGSICYLPRKLDIETMLAIYSENSGLKAYNINKKAQELFSKFLEEMNRGKINEQS